ncbi:hypothetical protein MTO96_045943 [Rhipicephalus appendiculatus]
MAAYASGASGPQSVSTDGIMAATQVSCRPYDPESKQWTTVPQVAPRVAPGGPVSASFRSAALNTAVQRVQAHVQGSAPSGGPRCSRRW